MNFAGYRLVYIPSSVVYHYGSASMKQFKSHKKVFFHHRNGLILLLKNYDVSELIRYLPVRVFFDFLTFWYYLLISRSFMNSWALLSAYMHFLLVLPQLIIQRKNAAFKRRSSKRFVYPLYKRSIVIDYFILGKKKFNQLNFPLPLYPDHRAS